MSNLGNLTCSNRSLLNLYCLMHAADTKATKVVLLTLCLAVAAAGYAGKNDLVKVLGNGEIKTAVTVTADAFSKSAISKIEAAGGKAVVNE